MKHLIATVAVLGVAVAVAATAGCSGSSATKIPTGAELKGTWSQSGSGYGMGVPDIWQDVTVVVTEADGQAFTGFKEHAERDQAPKKETVNGVVGVDGDILITDEDGIFRGRLVDGKIVGQYAEVGPDNAALNVELVRK